MGDLVLAYLRRRADRPVSMMELQLAIAGTAVSFPVRRAVWRLIDAGLVDFTPLRDVYLTEPNNG